MSWLTLTSLITTYQSLLNIWNYNAQALFVKLAQQWITWEESLKEWLSTLHQPVGMSWEVFLSKLIMCRNTPPLWVASFLRQCVQNNIWGGELRLEHASEQMHVHMLTSLCSIQCMCGVLFCRPCCDVPSVMGCKLQL